MRLPPDPAAGEATAEQATELGDDGCGEARIVDMLGHADEAARGSLPNGRFERSEKLFVGIRI
jgi:hypothetical protein